MLDMRIKRFQKIINIVLCVIFVFCLVLLIRWSTVEIYDIFSESVFLNYVFVTKDEVDAVLMSIVSGYVIGFITYALTVLLPTYFRNKPMQFQFALELQELYACSLSTLLIIYKSVSTHQEWQNINTSDDLDALNDDFYIKIKRFDVCSEAYTIYGKYDGRKYNWSEYLTKMCKHIQERSRQLLLYYQAYLTEEMYDTIADTVNDKFLGMITGESVNVISQVVGENGYRYFEAISVADYYEMTDNPAPIFCTDMNIILLKQYVCLLHRQKKTICSVLGRDKMLKSNYYLSEMTNKKIGKYESAIWRKVENHE